MKRRKMFGSHLIVAALVVVSLLILAAAPGRAQQLTPLKVGIMRLAGMLPIYHAQAEGFYKDAGLDFQPQEISGGAVILPALTGGSIEIGYTNVVSLFIARDQGFNYIITTSNAYENKVRDPGSPLGYKGTTAVLVRADSPIKSVKDLEGKTIAVNTRRNIVTLTTQELMAQRGADPKTVTWIEVPFPRMAAPLEMKQVDAIATVQPFVPIYVAQHKFRIVDYSYAGITDLDFPVALFAAREDWVRDHRETLDRFNQATIRGMDYIMQHPDKQTELAVRYLKMKPEVAKMVQWNIYKKEVSLDGLQWVSDLTLKWDLIKKKQDVSTFVYRKKG